MLGESLPDNADCNQEQGSIQGGRSRDAERGAWPCWMAEGPGILPEPPSIECPAAVGGQDSDL